MPSPLQRWFGLTYLVDIAKDHSNRDLTDATANYYIYILEGLHAPGGQGRHGITI